MKKVVVIGANSYIARNLIYTLRNEYFNIELRLYDYAEKQIDGEDDYIKVDLLSKESIKMLELECDVIFMFVGKTGSYNGFDEVETFIDVNQKMLLNLLNEYRRQNSKAKIIFPSTRLVYKGKKEALSEDSEKEFKTIYAMNKFACEQYLEQYNRVFGVKYCIFRICIPYGTVINSASSYGTVDFMLKKAKVGENITLYGDGSLRRTFTYILDICHIIIECAFCSKCTNDVFNIGGEDYSLKEIAELMAKKYNVEVDYIEWPETAKSIESGDTVFDDTKLKKNGVKYEMRLTQWIEDTVV